ncbi:MAG: hypothetical protein ACKPKO_42305 [Candidatus Fonsibacter sp.]
MFMIVFQSFRCNYFITVWASYCYHFFRFSTTSGVTSLLDTLGDSTSVTCSTAVLFDVFWASFCFWCWFRCWFYMWFRLFCLCCVVIKFYSCLSTATVIIFGLVDTILDTRFGLLGLVVSTTSIASTGSASSCDTNRCVIPQSLN